MDLFNKILKILCVVIVVLLIDSNTGCRDPYDFQPPFDSLTPAPDAPQLLHPLNDTTFMYDQWNPFPNDIDLDWSFVEGTEYYELQVDVDTSFTGNPIRAYSSSYTLTVTNDGRYYWKVRAYSRDWEWYTEWSEIWNFGAFYTP